MSSADDAAAASASAGAAAASASAAAQNAAIAVSNASVLSTLANGGASTNRIFPTTAAGLGATVNGNYFYVPATSAQGAFDVWQNNSGTALLITTLPNLAAVVGFSSTTDPTQGAKLIGYNAGGTNATPRYLWDKLVDEPLNPIDRGVLYSGITGTAATLSAAIQYALTRKSRTGAGGTAYSPTSIRLPAGVYLIDQLITITQPVSQANWPDQAKLHIHGHPGGTVIVGAETLTTMFYLLNIRVEWHGCLFIGNAAQTSVAMKLGDDQATSITPVYDSHFHELDFYGFNQAFQFGHCFDSSFTDITSFNHTGTNAAFINALPQTVDNHNNLRFARVHAEAVNHGGAFIYARAGAGSANAHHNWKFDTCHFETRNYDARAWDLQGMQAIRAEQTTFNRNQTTYGGGVAQTSSVSIIKLDGCVDTSIEGGFIQHIGTQVSGLPQLIEFENGTTHFRCSAYINPSSTTASPGQSEFLLNNSTSDAVGSTVEFASGIANFAHNKFRTPWKVTAPDSANRQWRGRVTLNTGDGNPGSLAFGYSNDTTSQAWSDFALLDNTGNFGIGTLTPSSKLHLYQLNSGFVQVVQRIENPGSAANTGVAIDFNAWNTAALTGARIRAYTNASALHKVTVSCYSGTTLIDVLTATGGNAVGIGTATPSSTLAVAGSIATASVSKAISYTLTLNDRSVRFNTTSGNLTATLPAGSTCGGREYMVFKSDTSANTLTLALTGADTFMDGTANKVISVAGGLFVQSDGATPATWAFK